MELKRPIEITITGRQHFSATDLFFAPEHFAAQEEDEISFELPQKNERSVELSTSGSLSVDEGGISLSYDESPITGLDGSTTTFTLSDGVVLLWRAGETKSHLVFEHGKRFQLCGEGHLPVSVQCHSLSHDLSFEGGVIDIDYSVEVAGSTVEHNSYHIRVNV